MVGGSGSGESAVWVGRGKGGKEEGMGRRDMYGGRGRGRGRLGRGEMGGLGRGEGV